VSRQRLHAELRLGLGVLVLSSLAALVAVGSLVRAGSAPTAPAESSDSVGARDGSPAAHEVAGRGRVSVRGGTTTVEGKGWTRTLRCPDRKPREVRVDGVGLMVTLEGTCEHVEVAGEGNEVHLGDTAGLRDLVVTGANHRLRGEAPPQAFLSLRQTGQGHRFEGALGALEGRRERVAGGAEKD